jgi:putative ABC transport system permease protein
LTVRFSLDRKYRDNQAVTAYFQQTLGRLSSLPGVESAGATLSLPLSGGAGSRYFAIEGRPPQPPGQGYNANLNFTAPGYFKTMGIPLVKGRDFGDQDIEGSPEVAIINEEMVRQFWPNEDAIGQRIRVGDGPWRTVVGVVGNIKYKALDADTRQEMYWPYYQVGVGGGAMVVRTSGDPKEMIGAVRGTILEIDQNTPLYDVKSMEEIMTESVAGRWLNTLLLAVFGGAALLLAAVGLYGVISYSVTQRTHEIGVRMALGATSRDILKLVVGHGMALVAIGIVIGTAGAVALTRFMSSLLFEVTPRDPVTIAVIALVLAASAFLASYIPARRATRVDPMEALRYE